MNISKNKILIFSVITIGLFIVLYLMFSNTNKKFDSKEWKETESTLSLRYDMIKDLKNHYNLIGQSKEQIVELLGEPDTAFNHCYYYNLGYSRHGIDTGTLIIVFNNNNTVASISVISG